jgi:hypothetical protein
MMLFRRGHRKKSTRTPSEAVLGAAGARTGEYGGLVDFFLFPRLKSIMKAARFADVSAIQERLTAVLRSIPNEAFADNFRKLCERCQQCVVNDGDYFEANLVNLFVSFALFVFWYHSLNFFRHTTYIFKTNCISAHENHKFLEHFH